MQLLAFVSKDQVLAYSILRAYILLAFDLNQLGGKTRDLDINASFHMHPRMVSNVRKEFARAKSKQKLLRSAAVNHRKHIRIRACNCSQIKQSYCKFWTTSLMKPFDAF